MAKKVHKTVNLEVKLDVIRRMASGDHVVDLDQHLGLPPATVRTIYKNAKQIRKSAKCAMPLTSKVITNKKSS